MGKTTIKPMDKVLGMAQYVPYGGSGGPVWMREHKETGQGTN